MMTQGVDDDVGNDGAGTWVDENVDEDASKVDAVTEGLQDVPSRHAALTEIARRKNLCHGRAHR
jgi:hypothetical protein